ncbi:MAG: DUF4249 domain-containing protein [Cyclobacteriaceae bacterium]
MKKHFSIYILFLGLIFAACEDTIFPTLRDVPAVLVVDAWVTNKPEAQVIKLTRSQPYFDQTRPVGVNGATIKVIDDQGQEYNFEANEEPGHYYWIPADDNDSFGEVGRSYSLQIELDGDIYESESDMGRVPEIDSIGYFFEEGALGIPDSWIAEFWARDFQGAGDTYWARGWKNGVPFLRPAEIITAYDAGFGRGGNVDGLIFIAPIRRGFNALDQDEDDAFLPSYEPGDSLYVELHSITEDAFDFLGQVATQTNRPGGFGELFAQPLANVPTNIRVNGEVDNKLVVGFFNVAAVTANGRRLRVEDYE